jgi:S-adenosylmethionine:tRNA ribosyltransferase-isomerase
MKSSEFEYELPRDLIAQEPSAERTGSRLLVIRRDAGAIEHCTFSDLPNLLAQGDMLVLNETSVIPARIRLARNPTGGSVEALLVRPRGDGVWEALLTPSRRLRPGDRLDSIRKPGAPRAEIVSRAESGKWLLRELNGPLEDLGETPLPPYIRRDTGEDPSAADRERYQTVYARVPGSVAAPTAGLHFTDRMIESLSRAGVEIARIVLHVGPGTFRPISGENVEEHVMDPERYEIAAEETARMAAAFRAGKRFVAVGTTCVRVLETLGPAGLGSEDPARGETAIFISPGYRFSLAGAMLTNFHMPRSTPYALVCALAGLDLIRRAYAEAIERRYRFLSYGDAMLIL